MADDGILLELVIDVVFERLVKQGCRNVPKYVLYHKHLKFALTGLMTAIVVELLKPENGGNIFVVGQHSTVIAGLDYAAFSESLETQISKVFFFILER